jgi:hypothetical protein
MMSAFSRNIRLVFHGQLHVGVKQSVGFFMDPRILVGLPDEFCDLVGTRVEPRDVREDVDKHGDGNHVEHLIICLLFYP